MNPFEEAADRLAKQAKKDPALLISYSAGKDALAVLDLACRCGFTNIVGFYMYLVPGLTHIEEALKWAKRKYRIQIVQYPHINLPRNLRRGVYTNPSYRYDDLEEFTLHELYQVIMRDTGITTIATGMKKADSMSRRRNFKNLSQCEGGTVINPLENWNKFDVLAYIKMHKLPLPKSSGRATTGVDLTARELLWVHDTYPEDFAKMRAVFPFIDVVVKRREWYGIAP